MIIATAGHVDHGKTSLVKALTGTNTDRLAEEQRRGMSIDLGFAYADLHAMDADAADDGADLEPLAFVDVPGHERFIRNMLAGVAAIDLALLVVAADDGAMPQTREHLAILTLLGVPALVVALTKVDRVDAQRLKTVEAELVALLAGGPYAQAPRFAVATLEGRGLPALRRHLAAAARAWPARRAGGLFRLVVDRSFTLPGAGRVVTGTVLSGRVQVGDELTVSPQGALLRVRGLFAQNRRAESVCAGQRCALNLAGIDLKRADPARGDWLLAPSAHAPSQRLDVQLQVLAGEGAPLSQRHALQLHIGAASCNARVTALDAATLAPASQGLAQLLLDRPVAAVFGDRFILRDAAAGRALAGGHVVDPAAPARGRSRPARLRQLAALALADPEAALRALLAASPEGIVLAPFHRARNLNEHQAVALQARLGLRQMAIPGGSLAFSDAAWQDWRDRLLVALEGCHAAQPHSRGPDGRQLRQAIQAIARVDTGDGTPAAQAGRAAADGVMRATLAELVDAGQVQRVGLRFCRSGHQPVLDAADSELMDRVLSVLRPAGLRPPIVGELASQLALPLPTLLEFLGRMVEGGHLVRVAHNRYYPPEAVAGLLAQARALAAEQADGSYDAAGYRDRTGIGRNLSVQVLEFLDRAGFSRFDGSRHRPL